MSILQIAQAVSLGQFDIYYAEHLCVTASFAQLFSDWEKSVEALHTALTRHENERVKVAERIRKMARTYLPRNRPPREILARAETLNASALLDDETVRTILREEFVAMKAAK